MPRRNVSLRDFKAPPLGNSKGAALPARARELLELLVLGIAPGEAPPTIEAVAEHMGIKVSTAKLYFRHPLARSYYLAILETLRDQERPRNFHTARDIRDDRQMAKSAAGNRVRIEAARFLEGRDDNGGVTVNVGINTNIMPGYQVVIGGEHVDAARAILAQAGSSKNMASGEPGDAPGPVIEHEAVEVPPSSEPAPADSAAPAFGRPAFEAVPPRDSRRRPDYQRHE